MSTWRTELVELTPWVERLRPRRGAPRCDGYRWSSMSLRAAHDPARREDYRCRRRASWRYVAARGDFSGRSGRYCWSHLDQQLLHMPDDDRLSAWFQEHLDEVNAIRTRHGYPPMPARPSTT